MLLGPSAVAPRDKRGIVGRTIGASAFGIAMVSGIWLLLGKQVGGLTRHLDADFGSIDAFGRTLFSDGTVPFELSSALLMVAVVGAVAVARGKQGEEHPALPSGQPGLAVRSPRKDGFVTLTATRQEGHAK
jgi:NADH-quinone oxidoreductase subunit J